MAGTNQYDVCIVFILDAVDDEDALDTVREYLLRDSSHLTWAWIYTTQTNKGEA